MADQNNPAEGKIVTTPFGKDGAYRHRIHKDRYEAIDIIDPPGLFNVPGLGITRDAAGEVTVRIDGSTKKPDTTWPPPPPK